MKRLWNGVLSVGARFVRLPFDCPSNLWLPVGFYAPMVASFLLWNLSADSPPPAWALVAGPLAGLLFWTLVEYVLHAGAFHWPFSGSRLRAAQYALHWNHHDEPTDPNRILARLAVSAPLAVAFWFGFRLVVGSWSLAGLPMAGLIVGYLWYEAIHFRIHTSRKSGRLLRAMARYHLYHHFKDPTRCFGVTTPLWDIVFRTGRRRAASAIPPGR